MSTKRVSKNAQIPGSIFWCLEKYFLYFPSCNLFFGALINNNCWQVEHDAVEADNSSDMPKTRRSGRIPGGILKENERQRRIDEIMQDTQEKQKINLEVFHR